MYFDSNFLSGSCSRLSATSVWENYWYSTDAGIGLDQASIKAIHDAMMKNTAVRATILREDVSEIGIGVHKGEYQGKTAVFVDEVFASPTIAEAAETEPTAAVLGSAASGLMSSAFDLL